MPLLHCLVSLKLTTSFFKNSNSRFLWLKVWVTGEIKTYFNYLSGIDVLSSGYDAATWSTKYSIFNFKEEGELVHINSINKTYTAPAMVNVVTDGMNSKRVEDSCIDVVSHFEGNS